MTIDSETPVEPTPARHWATGSFMIRELDEFDVLVERLHEDRASAA